jgi:hypothetical protein
MASRPAGTDPTPEEIAAMCAAIQATWTLAQRHKAEGRRCWNERELHRDSQATHIPHGISAEALGARLTLDIFIG